MMALKKSTRPNIENLPSVREKLAYFEKHKDIVYGRMIPEPDYSDEEIDSKSSPRSNKLGSKNNMTVNTPNFSNNSTQKENNYGESRFDEQGLILPKRLPNPCMESKDKKSLHRELLFNQKLGISVLNQKSELQKALEKHKDKKDLKERDKEKLANITPLQKAIEERTQRLNEKSKENETQENNDCLTSEFHQIHAKFQSKIEAK